MGHTPKEQIMKTPVATLLLALTLVWTTAGVSPALAADVKMIGTVTKIVMAPDNKSATVILKDVNNGTETTITVLDELTLDKFLDKRISDDDEIRCTYDDAGGKNVSKSFRKTAGC
jgi:hypothetical protein